MEKVFDKRTSVSVGDSKGLARATWPFGRVTLLEARQAGLLLCYKTMTLTTDEFIRRFLIHILPGSFHRIRHYGLLANSGRQENLKRARELLMKKNDIDAANENSAIERTASNSEETPEPLQATFICPDCGSPMVIIEGFERGQLPRAPPAGLSAL